MKSVKSIVYRNLTHADFFNINKPPGMEAGGGGQAYIDFPVRSVRLEDWNSFFEPIINVKRTTATQGPCWNFPVYSIGISKSGNADQELKIYQRRAASVNLRDDYPGLLRDVAEFLKTALSVSTVFRYWFCCATGAVHQ